MASIAKLKLSAYCVKQGGIMPLFCRRSVLVACGALLLGTPAIAQPYPSHPVKIVVPFPAGGSNDIIARILAQRLTERTGQPFLVENRGGAGGNIGADAVGGSGAGGCKVV